MKSLILFSSHDGQTSKIASYIASEVRKSQECDVAAILSQSLVDWESYNRLLLGGSVRYGRFSTILTDFVHRNLREIQTHPSGFFAVNLTARKSNKNTPKTNIYTYKFLKKSSWQPDCCAVFAGALKYPRYRPLDRAIIRLIMYLTGGETDPRKEVEYTDWSKVKNFAREFIRLKS
jgi:menaquinone-dependent protoporphyrinogen oxidase